MIRRTREFTPLSASRITVMLALAAAISAVSPLLSARAAELRPDARFLATVDLEGNPRHIGQEEHSHGAALVFLTTECPIARQFIPELNRLADVAADAHIEFYGVICDATIKRSDAAKFAREFKIEFPVLFDGTGELVEAFRPTHVPEAFVVDLSGRLAYRGRIDDRYAEVGKKRDAPRNRDLLAAIKAVAAGQQFETPETEVVGCPLEATRAADDSVEVTYTRDIAPILFAKCAECHRPGEVAPFSLVTYDDAAKRSDWIREVTQSRLMPPWKAEIDFGHFLGERRLTDKELALIEAWAAAGAPEGDADDLPPQPQFAEGWALGEPDVVAEAPTFFTMPADGPDIFQHWVIPLNLEEDQVMTGFEFRPGNPAVVHHAVLMLDTRGLARQKDAETPEPGFTTSGSVGVPTGGLLGVWTPGMTPRFYPDKIGMVIPKGADLVMQLHLHPSGKEEADQSKVGLHFADQDSAEAVERTVSPSPLVVGTIMLDIPAGTDEHRVSSTVQVPADVSLISVLPHMHLIGKEMKIEARLPDGELLPLIWIKDWNFYWQDNYVYKEPVRLPAGSELTVISTYDNSAANPLNPSDPPRRVLFGNESTDEMCFGIFQMVADNPEDDGKLTRALIQTFMSDWQRSDLADDAREHIITEAGKLFGGSTTQLLEGFFGGGQGREARGGN